MTILVTLTFAGSDTGPFDIYTNVDGFVTPIAVGVSKAALEAGYTILGVPDSASIIRVQSLGICDNYLDILLAGATTTTTTTAFTTSTTTTTSPACLTGDTNAISSCLSGEAALFTVTPGNTALITPGGYYYSGTGTRYYSAYIMNSTNTAVLYTFNYVQVDSFAGTWTSDLPSDTLSAGTYYLRTDTVNCFDGSGTFSLVATCNTPG